MATTMEFSAKAAAAAPPDAVWGVLSNPATWAEWWDQWDRATADEPLRQGAVVKMGRIDLDPEVGDRVREMNEYPMEVTQFEEGRRIAIRNKFIGEELFVFELSPADGGTVIQYRREAKVPKLLGFLGRAMKGRLEKEAEKTASGLAQAASV